MGGHIDSQTIEHYLFPKYSTSLNERRKFLDSVGKLGAAAAGSIIVGCLGLQGNPAMNYSYNPNRGRGQFVSFHRSNPWTPGMGWKLRTRTPIYAAARGKIVLQRKINKAGHAGGIDLYLIHTDKDLYRDANYNFTPGFRSRYYHLNSLEISDEIKERNNMVNRGELLGYAGDDSTYNTFGFGLTDNGNLVNPDDYGINHGPMDFWDGTDMEISNPVERSINQRWVVKQLLQRYKGSDKNGLLTKVHKSGYYGTVRWSTVECFRYLLNSGQVDMPAAEMNELAKEFYDNQPVILSLPFK
jgi:murein DD-endopeptidase MepM/ murein hydrolase activator NlpD